MTNEKIKKLQLEIAKTTEAQKKSEQKYKEKIKGLRDELKKEEERQKLYFLPKAFNIICINFTKQVSHYVSDQ